MQTKNTVGSGVQHRLHKRSTVVQGLLNSSLFGHVAKHQHCTNNLPISVAYGCAAVGNVALVAIARNQYRVIR